MFTDFIQSERFKPSKQVLTDYSSVLKMEAVCLAEMRVNFYQTLRSNHISEELRPVASSCENSNANFVPHKVCNLHLKFSVYHENFFLQFYIPRNVFSRTP
jgi:hypothetical protein